LADFTGADFTGADFTGADFTGKTVLVTGASKGLGRVAAEAFSIAGANLVLSGRSSDKLEELASQLPKTCDALVVPGDLLERDEVEALATAALERFGVVDIILHALGGGYGFREPLLEWDQLSILHHLNIGAGAELNRLLAPAMREAGSGRILHVCSIASGEAVASVGYNTVKAGLAAYVRGLGRALAGDGIAVTGILPGAFEGPDNAFARLKANNPDAYKEFETDRLPRGKVGRAEEVVPLIFFLAGEGAAMMGGSCVPIDAGEGFAIIPDAFS